MTADLRDELERTQEQLLRFARDLRDAIEAERSRRQQADAAVRSLRASQLDMIRTLAMVCEIKDNGTRHHLDRTYQYAMALTRRMVPELAEDPAVGYGFLLHDIGKVGVPDRVLAKPAPLDVDEWQVMRTHPVIGEQLVRAIGVLGDAVAIVRSHHERWDGRGYPDRLAGEDIYLPARIFAVIDTFDAMTSDRPYRPGAPVHRAVEEIAAQAGAQFDPDVVQAFVDMCDELGLADADDLVFVR